MSSTFTALDDLEREMNRYLNDTQATGCGDIGPVLFHSARVQMEIQDLSQRVQQKSIALEDRARSS
ncbi:hypothetical protein conserved [Leishmania donovani]|uniref:Uncharacterized protein n=3 Tax=Leishmania donovani species complex TaxID=38574 RepID=E9AHB4_LEIIN|nr:hypothetical protein LINJ_26_0990 [Leishmania infantum JPCM5]CAC9496453.1 hypothetical_protein_-_conserved [Leishmania infantum]CAJ1989687.1 hypothetical protein conserved [Leishmania donovani]CBZ08787.1 hypothetical protein LINJ_26_0990 [Leishmania infantum JPCM5]SUZ42691.1 hypothetical_protein_-_conserved [Leishmania infantum]VDZ45552.1 hypothetical_protein_conserved [Leishmania donovani]|eukprot:XP_003392615.1 hypothetical protein LINJ_26_0990 [Leishmania infantum JPCM5]